MLSGLAGNMAGSRAGKVSKPSTVPVTIHTLGSMQHGIQGEGKQAKSVLKSYFYYFFMGTCVTRRVRV